MYCLSVIMCQSCTSGMWGRVPGRLVWSRRLVCVYLTAPHSCVLSKCNRRRPHPSEKGILPPPTRLFSYSSLLLSPSPDFFSFKCVHCKDVSKQARGRVRGQPVNRRVSPAFLSFQEGVHFSRSSLWASQHTWGGWGGGLCLWQHRRNLSKCNLSNNLSQVCFAIKVLFKSSMNALLVPICYLLQLMDWNLK